ncbi:hypothetical protein EDD18DRAFT_710510 [Armillaria luteobubalina]|uniref:Uncharacterized protein n=1 Tax=Armillaria luteobubalina TaxID=153913 RepID=A0AA39PIX3_9AGAR|nr:hypothetical protein EDD18DRAFT_710510 [Armillaria luteobubalina]
MDAMSVPLDMGAGLQTAAYLRVASLAIAFYDFMQTLPSAYRFYKEQWEAPRLLFTSIVVIIVSSFGFFYTRFTDASCARFYALPSIFKVLQAMVSQAILGIRAYNLSRRSRKILYTLLLLYLSACVLQWISTVARRTPYRDPQYGNCRALVSMWPFGAWNYYAVAITYDVATTAISVIYLLKFKLNSTSSIMLKMLYDGLGYFSVLTGVNILNLVLYQTKYDIQLAATSVGYCVTWVMSQRLLIHLHDASRERRMQTINTEMTITRDIENARDVSHALRSQFRPKSGLSFELTVPDFDMLTTTDEYPETPEVHVRIERTVTADQGTASGFTLEDYSRGSAARLQRSSYQ